MKSTRLGFDGIALLAIASLFNVDRIAFGQPKIESKTPYGYEYFQLRDGLLNCQAKFTHEKAGRVAFVGGSITASKGWRELVCEELKQRFPETQFEFIAAGISSLGSTPGAFRLDRDVLSKGKVDLLFEEAAVNDDTNGFNDTEQVRGLEGIVRQARLVNPAMDIVLLHFADPGKVALYNQGTTPAVIVNHEKVAEHYRVPSIDLAKEVTERIRAGEFEWDKDFKNLHPSPFGHQLYSRSIARLFTAAWQKSTLPLTQARPYILPEPVDPHSYFHGRLLRPDEADTSKSLTLDSRWTLESHWKPNDKVGTREGFVNVPTLIAESPGATLKLNFRGIGIGVFVASGPDAGNLEFRVDNGAWQRIELFTQWSPNLHLPWAKMLASELKPGEHTLELRVASDADPRSKGNAIRITHFLVNGNSFGQ